MTSPLDHLTAVLWHLTLIVAGGAVLALVIVVAMRLCELHWTWTTLLAPMGILASAIDSITGTVILAYAVLVSVVGARWHGDDVRAGADLAADARRRLTPLGALRRYRQRAEIRRGHSINERGLAVGRQAQGTVVRIPVSGTSGQHTLVVGATGSGKTVTQAWIASRLIANGHGAVVIDPKGDALLHATLHRAARSARRTFHEWTPAGPAIYNPFAHGTDTELADKALAGETYTEPHYLANRSATSATPPAPSVALASP